MPTPRQNPEAIQTITEFDRPTAMLKSQYGTVPYSVWCERDVMRIREQGGQAVIVERDGLIAIAHAPMQP